MKYCYAIRDEKAGVYLSPFFTNGIVDAMRSLSIAANQPESNLNKFPEDFTLYAICKMDEKTGQIIPELNMPELITPVAQIVQPKTSNKEKQ